MQPDTSLELGEENIEEMEVEVQWWVPVAGGVIGGYDGYRGCDGCNAGQKVEAVIVGGAIGAIGGGRAKLVGEIAEAAATQVGKAVGKVVENLVIPVGANELIDKSIEKIKKP